MIFLNVRKYFSCEEQTDESTCNSSYCDYYSLGSTDQSYVAISETTGEGLRRYYCGQDNNTLIDIPPSASSAWKWWDAYEQGTSFLIHNYDNIDYIANGQEWFYCNANQSNIHNVGIKCITCC